MILAGQETCPFFKKLSDMRRENQDKLSKTAASGLVALVFLVLGFQLAIFVVKVVERSPVGVGDDVAVGVEDFNVS